MSRCTHIGALLYLLEEVKFDETPKLHLSTTDTPRYWGGGQKSNHNPKPLGDNDYERVFPENRYKDFNPIPERFQKTSDETNKDIDDFLGTYLLLILFLGYFSKVFNNFQSHFSMSKIR